MHVGIGSIAFRNDGLGDLALTTLMLGSLLLEVAIDWVLVASIVVVAERLLIRHLGRSGEGGGR